MRSNYLRNIGYLTNQLNTTAKNAFKIKATFAIEANVNIFKILQIPPEFNGKDWLTFLLHIDAELEHSLMVQYLYAAYSLGGDDIPEDMQSLVRGWQEIISGIAKEEMGHFVSVQNVLRLIGAPLHFDRQDFPWDSKLYPFEFMLEPFSKKSLAKYIYAESPKNWLQIDDQDDDETKEIKEEIKGLLPENLLGDPISVLFEQIIELLGNEDLIPDEIFMSETYPYQAKFDEWGRGYSGGARGNSMQANPSGTPDVLVKPVIARTDTIDVMKAIAEQGESPSEEGEDPSHFNRFLSIYKTWRKIPGLNPSRNLAINPTISPNDNIDEVDNLSFQTTDIITNPVAKSWANLFNVRYRMLLNYLTHTFLLADGLNNIANTPRGTIIHATFGEMYNLRSIANVLVKLPLGNDTLKMAGPPFLIPYTMDLPTGEENRWKIHLDLLKASERILETLMAIDNQPYLVYLNSLSQADSQFKAIANKITTATF